MRDETDWVFALLAMASVPVWVFMAWYWDDIIPLFGAAGAQLFAIRTVYRASQVQS